MACPHRLEILPENPAMFRENKLSNKDKRGEKEDRKESKLQPKWAKYSKFKKQKK